MSDLFDHEMEAWDRLEAGEEDGGYDTKQVSCKYCGKGGGRLHWVLVDFKWRLFDKTIRSIHTCKEYKKNE